VRLVADVGLCLLPFLVAEILTGLVLFLFAHGLTPNGTELGGEIFNALASADLLYLQDITFQTDVHVWAGYLSAGLIALKVLASWPTLVGWRPRRFGPSRRIVEKALAWALLALALTCYVTGLALTARPDAPLLLSSRSWRDLHLWSSALLVVPLAWHVWRFYPTAIRVLTVQLRRLARFRQERTVRASP
jgi:hypothetical protein